MPKTQIRPRPTKSKKREFTVVIEKGEDGYYIGSVPALLGCHTQGKTVDELMVNVKEAILLCLDVAGEDTASGELIGIHRVSV